MNTRLSRKTSQVSANWGHWKIAKWGSILSSCAAYPETIGLSYREGVMTTEIYHTGMKRARKLTTHKSRHTDTHREAWCAQAGGSLSDACLFPPGMQRRGRWEEEKERWGWGGWEERKKQAEDESRRGETPIKNDSRRRTRQGTERKKRDYTGSGERQKESSLDKWGSWKKKW